MESRLMSRGSLSSCFFIVSYNGKSFHVSTGLQSTIKFEGTTFPASVPNHKAKTSRLVRLYSEVEAYVLTHPNELHQKMKEDIKSIVGGRTIEVGKNLLFYIDEYIKTKTKEGTKKVFLTTRGRVEKFDAPKNTMRSLGI